MKFSKQFVRDIQLDWNLAITSCSERTWPLPSHQRKLLREGMIKRIILLDNLTRMEILSSPPCFKRLLNEILLLTRLEQIHCCKGKSPTSFQAIWKPSLDFPGPILELLHAAVCLMSTYYYICNPVTLYNISPPIVFVSLRFLFVSLLYKMFLKVPFKKRPKTMIPIVCQQNNSHTIKPSPPARKLDTRQDGSIHSGCLCQTLILPSKYHRRNQDSSDQATFSVVYCPILLNTANCGFSFLFLANWTLLIIYLH